MLLGLLILLVIALVDLVALGGIVTGFIVTALRLRRSRLARPGAVTIRPWASLVALAASLGLLALASAWLLLWVNSADYQGKPTQAQVAGTWTGNDGAVLWVWPNGTFTATALPPDAGSSTGKDVILQPLPAEEHGTWQVTRGDGTWYVLCSLSGGPQFQLSIGPPTTPAGLLSANFTYVQGQFDVPINYEFSKHLRLLVTSGAQKI